MGTTDVDGGKDRPTKTTPTDPWELTLPGGVVVTTWIVWDPRAEESVTSTVRV